MRRTEGGLSAGARGPPGSAWPLSQHNQSGERCPVSAPWTKWGPPAREHFCLFVDLPGKRSNCRRLESHRASLSQHPIRGRWMLSLNRNEAATPLRTLNLKPVPSRPYLQLLPSTRAHPRFHTRNRRQGGEDPFREAPRGTLIRDLVGTGLPLLPAGPQVMTSLTSPPSGEDDKICASPRFLYNEIKSGGTGLGRDYPDRVYRSNQFPQIKIRI